MTVKELIGKLSEYPQDVEVRIALDFNFTVVTGHIDHVYGWETTSDTRLDATTEHAEYVTLMHDVRYP